MYLDHVLWPSSNVTTLRKLGITVPCRLATHHRKWMWHWESRLALPTTRNYWVSYVHGLSHCQVSCTRRSQDIIPHPFFQNKPNEPLFSVLISFDEVFQGPMDDCSLTLASNYSPHLLPSVVVSELGMEVYLDVLSSLWNTGLEKHSVPCNFHSFGFLFSLGFC